MTVESETVTTTEQATPVEQSQQVEQTSPEATTEQTQEQPEKQEAEAPKKEPWFQKRIGELTREKYEARRLAAEAEQRAREIEARYQQQQQGEQQPTERPNALDPNVIRQEAARLVAEQNFNEKCNQVYAKGKSEFPGEWDAALGNLQMVGVPREFLELATASDVGAKLIHHLGKDLDEAARIVALPPVLMARELTRLEIELGKPKAKPVSSAPAPITPVSGVTAGTKDPSEMTDKEFAEWRRKQIAQRHR